MDDNKNVELLEECKVEFPLQNNNFENDLNQNNTPAFNKDFFAEFDDPL